jgi:hypothetical protein
MFDDWKQAWRQAVENFQREISDSDAGGAPPRVRAMEREIVSASGALAKLDDEIRRTAKEVASEREAEQVCRRREGLAREVGDEETVRVAAEFAVRHGQRAAVLARKLEVFREERGLLAHDIEHMRKVIGETAPSASVGQGSERPALDDDSHQDREFSRMERDARERAAAERLEELKRRMRG